jgi:LDH2 family malate/lactate/ureidoglycolate dehydrogenase
MDMAMSQAAVGKVGTYHREGKEAPPGWGLDSSGQATNDPAAILASRKILPMGDHKGAALALMMELLTSALAGGLLSFEIAHRDVTALDPYASKFFLALDVSAFVDRSHYAQRVRDMMGYLQRTAEPGREILYPGERGWRTRDAYLQEGIPIHREIVAQLLAIGVSFPEAG